MKKVVVIIGLGLASFAAFSQTNETPSSYSFSLQQAVDFALQNQNNIKNAMLDEEIAKNKVKEVFGMGLPQVNASFDVKKFLELPTSLIPAEFFGGPPGSFAAVQFGTEYQATAGFDASQLLFSGDYFLGLKASKVYLELSSKATQRSKIETASTVSKAYYTVLINQERILLMDANIARLKKTMDDTKALLDNGLVEKLDHDRLTVAYNNLVLEHEKIERLLKVGVYLLKYQMGMDIAANLTLTDKLSDVKFDIGSDISAEKFDYAKRVEYNLYETQRHLAELDLKRNKFSFLPNAFAYGSVNGTAQRNEFNIFNTGYRWYPMALIGAKVAVPIFSGLQRNYKLQQAKVSLQKADNNMEFIKKSIDLELSSSLTVLQNAAASLENQKKNMIVAEDVFRVSKLKYDQGVGSNIEVITAETALKESQTNYYNALFDALVAKIDYDKANGALK
jgi:outer membrane protein TolC